MFQEFFPILEGAPMGDLWVLLTVGFIFMIVWMGIVWIWQRKRLVSGMDRVGWTSGLALLALFDAFKADGYGFRRFLIAALMSLSAGFLARRAWVMGEPAEPAGLKDFVLFECRGVQAVFLSLPVALLTIDPLPTITLYEWIGVLLWGIAMAGQILAPSRRSLYEWLVWVAFFSAALATPYGGWTLLCPVIMIVVQKPFHLESSEEHNSDIA